MADHSQHALAVACKQGSEQLLQTHATRKLLRIQMLRGATVSQFDTEISKDLRPRLQATGDEGLLQPFLDFFNNKEFRVGSSLLALWEGAHAPCCC